MRQNFENSSLVTEKALAIINFNACVHIEIEKMIAKLIIPLKL